MVKQSLTAALVSMVSLQDIWLEYVDDLHLSHFRNVSLPNLKLISLYGTVCDDALLSAIVHTTKKLQQINIGLCVDITDDGLTETAKCCPHLRGVGLEELPITDIAIEVLTKLCPCIDNLQFNSNEFVTDFGVSSALQNLQELRYISLAHCNALTDHSLDYLAKYCSPTLESLVVVGIPQGRVDVLIRLLQQCHQLRKLVLDCDIEPHCAEIVPYMHNLKSLLLYCVLSDQCVCLIAKHCKHLEELAIPCSYKVDVHVATTAHESAMEAGLGVVRMMQCTDQLAHRADPQYTDKGLIALMKGLPNLRQLYVPALNGGEISDMMVQHMWQRLRPGLQFELDDRSIYEKASNPTVEYA